MSRTLLLTLLLGAAATAAPAHDYQIGDLSIAHPYAFETPAGARAAAGYLSVTNNGDSPDRLIEIRSALPHAAIHTTVIEDDVARMVPVDALEIAPGETVALEPGGAHVMFMGLESGFERGASVPATLVFEEAGAIEVMLSVEPRKSEAMAPGHGDHHGGEAEE